METEDFPILGIDYVEFYVGSAAQTAYFLEHAFGFKRIAYAGLETRRLHAVTHVMEQGDVRFAITGALKKEAAVSHRVRRHGDGVKDIALRVPSAENAYRIALSRGAKPHRPVTSHSDAHGTVVTAAIETYGDTIHTFIERRGYDGPFLPGFQAVKGNDRVPGVGIRRIDHMVGNVELGKMDEWVGFYERVMGFKNIIHFTDSQVSTEYSALMSKVMQDGSGKIKFPINEPAQGKRKSQIEEYLDFNCGPGVQHIALETVNIINTVSELRRRGVRFLQIPRAYYEEAKVRFADIPEVDVERLGRLGVLMDRDDDGYLLQIFTKPIVDRPTLFFEIIERRGCQGFGLGNFKSLFEALELEQAKRGNL